MIGENSHSLYQNKNGSMHEGRGGRDKLRWSRVTPLLQVNSDSVHRDEIGEIVSSILLKGFQKLQIIRLSSFSFIITYMRVEVGGGRDTIPPPLPQENSVYAHRDEIGENVFSTLLKGFQKLQITRLFTIPFIITIKIKEYRRDEAHYPGLECPPPLLPSSEVFI